MNRLEQWGAELAMLLRREFEQVVELERTKARISALSEQIKKAGTSTAYGSTGEIPRVSGEW